ncbi:MAG: sulfotransferase, partial [Mycobacterium sp.]|nr:sulfotransferase [Mycobacterium sp.]
ETWSRGLDSFQAARAKYHPAQFYDVDYIDFVDDPVSTVADIYRHFGLKLTSEARQAMEAIHVESKTGPRAPKHTYSLADYGLTAESVKARFAGLQAR